MGSLATFVLVKTVGLTCGINPLNSPTTGVAISRFQRFPEDTGSFIANVDITPPPVQIHQLATFLWNILNNDRDANMAILECLEDTDDDLSRHPVQIFSAADLAHLASHLAESTRTLSDQARRMEAFPDEALWALGLIQQMILPCSLKPFPLQGTDNSLYRLCICEKASRQRGVCVDHLHRCKTSFCLFVFCSTIFLPCMQGVVAGSRVYHQRRHSGFPGDTWPDQPCAPANFQKWENAQPKNLQAVELSSSMFCTVVAIWNYFDSLVASDPSSEQRHRKHTSN